MTTQRAPCPTCDRGPRDRALAITTDERGTVAYCHRCGYVEHDGKTSVIDDSKRTATPSTRPAPDPDKLRSIWNRTLPLRGSPGERYLIEHRHCVLPPTDGDLRFLSGSDRYPPSLCARVTDLLTGDVISTHFTRLAPGGRGKAGTDRDKLLLAGHRKAGGVIRLWPDEAVTHGLGIAEGIETALAAAHAFTPMWAMIDAGNLAKFPVLNGIESLVIFADHDANGKGQAAAEACAQRWADAGREACIVTPDMPGDIADVVAA